MFFEAEGQYHIFYTGYNRDYSALGKPSQVLMHAYSDDLITWHKTQDALTFTPQEGYDSDDWRDPWVIRDEENDQYLLVLGTDCRVQKQDRQEELLNLLPRI